MGSTTGGNWEIHTAQKRSRKSKNPRRTVKLATPRGAATAQEAESRKKRARPKDKERPEHTEGAKSQKAERRGNPTTQAGRTKTETQRDPHKTREDENRKKEREKTSIPQRKRHRQTIRRQDKQCTIHSY